MGLVPSRRAGSPDSAKSPGAPTELAPREPEGTIGSRWKYRYLVIFGAMFALFLLVTGCSTGKQSTWDPVGPVADKQLELFHVMLWVMVAVFVLVEGVLLYAVIRFRHRPDRVPSRTHGNMPLEIIWTVIPTILILALGVWSVITLFELDQPSDPDDEVLNVDVTGHQWWFEFEYPDAGGGKRIVTANELRIPVDTSVKLRLLSDDVLHSFWVPKLAGKVDMVPTRSNEMWFKADSNKIDILPATYYGQCAELCGVSHALMRFRVVVLDQQDYDAWVADYGRPPAITERAKLGQATFDANCTLCHTITGPEDPARKESRRQGFLIGFDTPGLPVPAPNLTDLRVRSTLGAGLLDLSVDNLRRWLRNPEDVKPGNYMTDRALLYRDGDINLDDDQVDALIEYVLQVEVD